jgi:SAM-dependent methyltransferase
MNNLDIFLLPRAYDVIFQRNYDNECDFLRWCQETYGSCQDRSFLELGCGPARFARGMALRGYQGIGLDLNQEMLRYATAAAAQEGVELTLLHGDMAEFVLPRQVGLAACMLDTACHLVTNEQMVAHLRSVARGLLPGGVYVMDMAHPRVSMAPLARPGVRVARDGDMEIELVWGDPADPWDPIDQHWLTTVKMQVREHGRVVAQQEGRMPLRYYLAQELRALVALSGAFRALHWHGEVTYPPVPFDNDPGAYRRMVLVLVK